MEALRFQHVTDTSLEGHSRSRRLLLIDCVRDEEDKVTITNAAVAERACALAEASGGLQRMAALCVSAAAATTGTFRGARKALEAVPHPGLRDAAQVLLNQLADRPAPAIIARERITG